MDDSPNSLNFPAVKHFCYKVVTEQPHLNFLWQKVNRNTYYSVIFHYAAGKNVGLFKEKMSLIIPMYIILGLMPKILE